MTLLFAILSHTSLATLYLRYFGWRKIPLLYFVRPAVVELTGAKVVVKISLRRRTKNHLNSMYFGALAIGADCAGGLLPMQRIRRQPEKISLVFKDMTAEFLKRAEADVFFTCEQGEEIAQLVTDAANSEERVEMPVRVIATVPALTGSEPVANFTLTLSLKKKPGEEKPV